MRVFVTGATGFVGSAVVQDLLKAGHEVLGLASSDKSAQALKTFGVSVHRGDLNDVASLRQGVENSDGVIHTGFIHDFTRFKECCEIDRNVIQGIGSVLQGSKRPFVITSGVGLLPSGQLATEDLRPLVPAVNPRVATEEASRALVELGVNVSIVRLPPTTHGQGDHGFVPMLIQIARDKGISVYTEQGLNTWPAAHRVDAARVFRLAFEKGALGANYHAVAEQGIPFKEIAEAIGRGLSLPVVSKSVEESASHFGGFAHFAAMNVKASSAKTQETLGWKPNQAGLIEDMAKAGYFKV